MRFPASIFLSTETAGYVNALLGMEKYDEAFYVLARINLAKLDEFVREFSEASLDLVKMIIADPKSAKTAGTPAACANSR